MKNKGLSTKDEVNPPTAPLVEGDRVDNQREDEAEVQSEMLLLNRNEENHNIDNDEEGKGSGNLIVFNCSEETHNLQHDGTDDPTTLHKSLENHNYHDAVGKGSGDQTTETTEEKPGEIQCSKPNEENHYFHHEHVQDSDGESTATLEKNLEEVKPLSILEDNHNLHHEKECSYYQTTETVEVKRGEVQSLTMNEENHNKVGEGSYDKLIETRGLQSEYQEEIDHGRQSVELEPGTRQCSEPNKESQYFHYESVQGLNDQTTATQEKNLEEVRNSSILEDNQILDHKKEGPSSQTTENVEMTPREMKCLSMNEENHKKVGQGSDDQSIDIRGLQSEYQEEIDHDPETVELKLGKLHSLSIKEENHTIHHDKVGESSADQTIHTRELKSEYQEATDHGPETVELKPGELQSPNMKAENHNIHHDKVGGSCADQAIQNRELKSEYQEETDQTLEVKVEEKVVDPVFDGTEIPEVEVNRNLSDRSLDLDPDAQATAWPEKAVSIKNFVKEKSTVAVSSVLRRLSGKKDEDGENVSECVESTDNSSNFKGEEVSTPDSKPKEVSQKMVERSMWNPLNYVRSTKDVDSDNTVDQGEIVSTENSHAPPVLKGRIILYTRLGCQECREVRSFLHYRSLRYVEINIDVFPCRKLELEKYNGSSAVPMVFFNEVPIGGLSKLKEMDECGELKDKINDLLSGEPSKGPLPPLSGEDDESCSGAVDELATIVKKMRDSISVKDRFYRMRRYSNCFLGSEAVDFLLQDQDLQREQAVEFGRKLSSKNFFIHVLDENVFEDGNYLYRFLDHDPVVVSQCYNIPRGIIEKKPKSLTEISSWLRFLSFAIFEAYASEDGKHVDYRSIHGSEEFARYLRVVEELQRVEMNDLSREEKLAFFINLYNMMAIHAILIWGYPAGALERRKMFGDFKYVIGGNTYSLSAIQNGILRGNQRPPYNLIKPFGVKDKRSKIALPYPEPLIHFALVSGTRSGPALRCFSLGNVDKELMEAARNFLRNGGVGFNSETKVASVSKILRWYSVDFGKNDVEVLKHAANYLEPEKSEELLELLASTQLKVVYQPYDWGLNC